MADHELIRETMVSLGEGMEDCGFDAVLETVEGFGLVGRAVRNPRDSDQLRIIILYLKDLAKTIRAEAPSPDRTQAMSLLQETWETIRAAVHEEEEEAASKSRKSAPPPDRRHASLLRTQPPKQHSQTRALPPAKQPPVQGQRRPLPGTVVVAPSPKPRPKPRPSPAGGSYFRSR
jgi:hypothetical protein